MTNTPGEKPTTEIVVAAAQKALSKKNATITDVLQAMTAAEQAVVTSTFELTTMPPKKVSITEDQALAVKTLAELVSNVAWPTEVRKLEDGEKAALLNVAEQLDLVEKLIKDSDESIKEAVHNHFDTLAEKQGRVTEETPRNKDRHYILGDTENGGAPGTAQKFTRVPRAGSPVYGTPVPLDDFLLDMLEQGKIDRKTYLRWTREVRVVKPEAMFKDMKNPELLPIIREAVKFTSPSAAICLSKNDGTAQT